VSLDRREFLRASAALGGLSLVPRLAGAGEEGQLIELAQRPPNYEAVRSTFLSRITPVERFYIRGHFDTPSVDAEHWRLRLSGLVERPLELSLPELKKLRQTTVEAVLQCSGNGRALHRPRVPGVQWTRGAMGNAEWTGVRLRDVLGKAKLKKGATHLSLRGLDLPAMDSAPVFLRGIPLEKALDEDTLIAHSMNGRPLAPHHGAPARLVVPGWVGDDWVKWLSELAVLAEEPKGFFYETAYRFPKTPGPPGQAVPPEQMVPMTSHNIKSIIASHEPGQRLTAGPQTIRGMAFGGESRVRKVEVTIDGGQHWQDARLVGPATKYGFREFHFEWKATAGKWRLASRATDEAGEVQPETPVWNPSGYLYNAVDPFDVEVLP